MWPYDSTLTHEACGRTYLPKIAPSARRASNFQLAADAYTHLAAAQPQFYFTIGKLHFDAEEFQKAEEAYLKINERGDASEALKKFCLNVCYQRMSTPEAWALSLALSSLTEVARIRVAETVPDVCDFSHLATQSRYVYLDSIQFALKRSTEVK
jgi:tetratricopeptide (TPR) repeat protein